MGWMGEEDGREEERGEHMESKFRYTTRLLLEKPKSEERR